MASWTQRRAAVALLAGAVVAAAGCTEPQEGQQPAEGDGFAYGADQSVLDEATRGLEPVELTYQPTASSPESLSAASAIEFVEAVEERSGGKITVNMAWGQSIAPYGEIDDALTDGRLDIAFDVLLYTDQYPSFDAMGAVSQTGPGASLVGETTLTAMLTEMAWDSDALIREYEERGLQPLAPVITAGQYYVSCAEPLETLSDWEGAQVRIGSTRQREVVESVDAAPVSMEYTEAYEALERGALDCTLAPLTAISGFGLNEVAPYFYHWDEGSPADSGQGAHFVGTQVQELPLAYQQILFDSFADYFDGQMMGITDSAAASVAQAKESGGGVQPLPPQVEERMNRSQQESFDELVEEGELPADTLARAQEISDRWEESVLGADLEDRGGFADFDSWYDREDFDFRPLGEEIYEEVMLEHRPE